MTITTVTFRVYGADWYAVEGDLPEGAWSGGIPELALLMRLPGFVQARMNARLDESTLPTVGIRMRDGFQVEVESSPSALNPTAVAWRIDGVAVWISDCGPNVVAVAIDQMYHVLDFALDRALGQTATASATATTSITCPDCKGSRVYVGLGFTPAEACRRCNGTGVV